MSPEKNGGLENKKMLVFLSVIYISGDNYIDFTGKNMFFLFFSLDWK